MPGGVWVNHGDVMLNFCWSRRAGAGKRRRIGVQGFRVAPPRVMCDLLQGMKSESRWALEPMCALDPLLLIPRIEYVRDVHAFVLSQAQDYCLVILDMKNFHTVNDLYGYDTGDSVIEQFMLRLRKRLPLGSVSLRFRHGDEFLFFIPKTTIEAESLFKSFRDVCEATPALLVAQEAVFVSYRFAAIDLLREETMQALLTRAETALRAVKGQGSPRS